MMRTDRAGDLLLVARPEVFHRDRVPFELGASEHDGVPRARSVGQLPLCFHRTVAVGALGA